jgi:hypothetical protein
VTRHTPLVKEPSKTSVAVPPPASSHRLDLAELVVAAEEDRAEA